MMVHPFPFDLYNAYSLIKIIIKKSYLKYENLPKSLFAPSMYLFVSLIGAKSLFYTNINGSLLYIIKLF
jgi:hypothetical protein